MRKRAGVAAILSGALLGMSLTAAPGWAEPVAVPGPEDLGLDGISVAPALALERGSGRAVVSGSVTCSSPVFVLLHASVRQPVGESSRLVEASGGGEVFCDGETSFAFPISTERGRLKEGEATVFAAGLAGDPSGAFDAVEAGPVRASLTSASPR